MATADADTDREITGMNILLSISSFALMVFVSGGNILTLLAIARTTVLRTLANIYVASLAVADLIMGLGFSMIGIFMLPPLKLKYFDRNIQLCVFMQGTLLGCLIISSFHMTLISFDRYIYITRPYEYHRLFTKRNILLAIGVIWVFGVVLILFPQFVHNDVSDLLDCDLILTIPTWYLFYFTSTVYCINVVLACIFYGQILLAALRQRRSIQATAINVGNFDNNKGRNKEDRSNSSRLGWKSIKFFFTIFGFYFVCMTPCFVAIALDIYWTVDENLVRASTLVVMLNSGMNFIIYVVINKQFRRAFSDILHCRPSSQ